MAADVDIRFERETVDGVVAVGTYLDDAARRLGVKIGEECSSDEGGHACEVTVINGAELLSPLTTVEREHFTASGRKTDGSDRLACATRIEKSGELSIMTKEKPQEEKKEKTKDPFLEEFSALPLEKKIARLMKMEAETFGETIAFVVNSPLKVVEKVGDVISEFAIKMEREAEKARHSPEKPKTESKTNGDAKPKGPTRRATTTKKPRA